MYKNLSVLLKNIKNTSALIEYDFKNEAPCIDIRTQNNPLKKFLRYKEFNKNEGKFDCDNSNGTCSLTNDIYIELWGWSYENRFSMSDELKAKFGNAWTRFSADTMNSYQTTYTKAKEIYGAERVQENKLMLEFATYTHTIGNFSLVPFSFEENTPFNPYRNTKFKDYFDLSLKFIKERVDAKTFEQYIDTFFLNDYVDSEYNVLPLFSGHKELLSQEKMSINDVDALLPQTEKEMNEFLENVIRLIKLRSRRMAEKLIEKETVMPKSNKVCILNCIKPREIKEAVISFKDNPVECLAKIIPPVIISIGVISWVTALIMFIINGGYSMQIEAIKSYGMGPEGIERAFTTGTLNILQGNIMIVINLLLITQMVLYLISLYKENKKIKRIIMFSSLIFFSFVCIVSFVMKLINNRVIKLSASQEAWFIDLINGQGLKIFFIVIAGILAVFLIADIVIILTSKSKWIVGYELFSFTIIYALLPLLLLFVENVIPLVAGIVFVAFTAGIIWLIMNMLASGIGDGGSETTNTSSVSSKKKDIPNKTNYKVVKRKRKFLYKVKGIQHDYIETNNGYGSSEVCSLYELQKGKVHIYDEDTGERIFDYDIPWKK